jgi:hypothetical protein
MPSLRRVNPFRPARTATDPQGRVWELYTTRSAMPPLGPNQDFAHNTRMFEEPDPMEIGYAAVPLAIVGFVWTQILVPIMRVPTAYARGRRTHATRIEAVLFEYGIRETHFWTTTTDMVDGVLEQVALGLEDGKFVQPVGAVYSGSRED